MALAPLRKATPDELSVSQDTTVQPIRKATPEELGIDQRTSDQINQDQIFGKRGFFQQAGRQVLAGAGETILGAADLIDRGVSMFAPDPDAAAIRSEWRKELNDFAGTPEGVAGYAGATVGRLGEFIGEMALGGAALKGLGYTGKIAEAVSKIPGSSRLAQAARYLTQKAAMEVPLFSAVEGVRQEGNYKTRFNNAIAGAKMGLVFTGLSAIPGGVVSVGTLARVPLGNYLLGTNPIETAAILADDKISNEDKMIRLVDTAVNTWFTKEGFTKESSLKLHNMIADEYVKKGDTIPEYITQSIDKIVSEFDKKGEKAPAVREDARKVAAEIVDKYRSEVDKSMKKAKPTPVSPIDETGKVVEKKIEEEPLEQPITEEWITNRIEQLKKEAAPQAEEATQEIKLTDDPAVTQARQAEIDRLEEQNTAPVVREGQDKTDFHQDVVNELTNEVIKIDQQVEEASKEEAKGLEEVKSKIEDAIIEHSLAAEGVEAPLTLEQRVMDNLYQKREDLISKRDDPATTDEEVNKLQTEIRSVDSRINILKMQKADVEKVRRAAEIAKAESTMLKNQLAFQESSIGQRMAAMGPGKQGENKRERVGKGLIVETEVDQPPLAPISQQVQDVITKAFGIRAGKDIKRVKKVIDEMTGEEEYGAFLDDILYIADTLNKEGISDWQRAVTLGHESFHKMAKILGPDDPVVKAGIDTIRQKVQKKAGETEAEYKQRLEDVLAEEVGNLLVDKIEEGPYKSSITEWLKTFWARVKYFVGSANLEDISNLLTSDMLAGKVKKKVAIAETELDRMLDTQRQMDEEYGAQFRRTDDKNQMLTQLAIIEKELSVLPETRSGVSTEAIRKRLELKRDELFNKISGPQFRTPEIAGLHDFRKQVDERVKDIKLTSVSTLSPEYAAFKAKDPRLKEVLLPATVDVTEGQQRLIYHEGADFELFSQYQRSLSKQQEEQVSEAMDAIRSRDEVKLATFDARVQRVADGMVDYLDEMRVTRQNNLLNEINRTMSKDDAAAVQAVIERGISAEEAAGKYGVNSDDVKELSERIESARNWGLDDYIPKFERGHYRIVDGEGHTRAVGMTIRDAERKATDLIKKYPNLSLSLETGISVPDEIRTQVSRGTWFAITGKLAKAAKDEMPALTDIRAKVSKATGHVLTIKPSKVFAQPMQHRTGILEGEKNIFDVIYAYSHMMHKKMILDPVIERTQGALAKLSSMGAKNAAKMLENQLNAAKGFYSVQDKAIDEIIESVMLQDPSTYKGMTPALRGMIVKGIQKSTEIAGLDSPMVLSRLLNRARYLEGMTKFGYRPVAALVNLVSGYEHVFVKTGIKYMLDARKFMTTDIGKRFMKDNEWALGVSLAHDIAGNPMKAHTRTPLWSLMDYSKHQNLAYEEWHWLPIIFMQEKPLVLTITKLK
jgi:hypothetical protein